jgi:hypothetical protein
MLLSGNSQTAKHIEPDNNNAVAAAQRTPNGSQCLGAGGDMGTTPASCPVFEPAAVAMKTVEPLTSALPGASSPFGKIQLSVQYNMQRSVLVVTVHQCRNLIPCDKDNLADPYIRIFVMPDHSSATRKRTKMVKNNLNPSFEEKFEWPMSIADAGIRALDVAVKNDVTLFSKSRTAMGHVVIGLSSFRDLSSLTTAWYDLVDS